MYISINKRLIINYLSIYFAGLESINASVVLIKTRP